MEFVRPWPIYAAGFLTLWAISSDPAQAASASELCSQQVSLENSIGSQSTVELQIATRRIEEVLSREQRQTDQSEPAGDLETLLTVPQITNVQSADIVALASYCAAAGEILRTDRQGSDFRAQAYLHAALNFAERAASYETASLAAYRLGLVSINFATIPATRGNKQRSGTRSAIVQTKQAAAIGTGVCARLSGLDLSANAPDFISTLALKCATERASLAGDHQRAALAQLRLSRMAWSLLGRTDQDTIYLRQMIAEEVIGGLKSLSLVDAGPLRVELTRRLIDVGIDAQAIPAERLTELVSTLPPSNEQGPASRARYAATRSKLAQAAGDLGAARHHANMAIFHESQRPQPLALAQWYLLLAKAEPAKRKTHAMQAYYLLDAARPAISAVDPLTGESNFTLWMRDIFREAVDVTLIDAQLNDTQSIETAQDIVENFRAAEIQSVLGNDCVPPRNPFTPDQLTANELLLYPILLEDRLELIVAERGAGAGRAMYRRLPPNFSADRRKIASLVEEMNLSIGMGVEQSWRSAASELDKLLIAPIADRLNSNTTLIIVPDGALSALPFAALLDENDTFLVQRVRTAVSPSLAFSTAGDRRRGSDLSIVAASLEQEVELLAGVFPALQGTAREARIAAAAGSSTESVLIENFSRDELARALRGGAIDVLHLATHASFNGSSDRSFIVANGEAIRMSELRNLIGSNLSRGGLLDLIVLSACETAVGDEQAGMGLAGAAVQAGATSAIASLWQVSDAGTAELMQLFYEGYASGKTKADALRDAQLALIDRDNEFSDPYIWSAFSLLGGWR